MRTWPAVLAVLAVIAVIAVIAGAAVLAIALGPGYAGYDAAWSLVWGDELAHGELPSYDAPVAPTPHPLANAVAAVVSPFGDGGESALVALSFLAFAALLAGVIALGTRLSCWPAGVAAAVVLGTRGLLDREVAFASIDLPFLALLVWAGALEARTERRGTPVLALLLLAGLLRPEAWLLSIAYLVWLAVGRDLRALRGAAALAVGAPLLWALSDLVITGNPLHSLTGTRDLAAELDRPRGLSTALSGLPSSLAELAGTLPLIAGLVGLAGGLALAQHRRLAIPTVVLATGLVSFLVIGLAGLPVLLRYLLLPAAMITVMAGLGLMLPRHVRDGPARIAATVVSVVVGALLLASLPGAVNDVRNARSFTLARGEVHRDLRTLVGQPGFLAAAARCPEIRVPDFRTRPVLLLEDAIDPRRVVVGNLADGERGLLLTYGSQRAGAVFTLGAPGEVQLQALPAGGTLVARNRSWVADAVC